MAEKLENNNEVRMHVWFIHSQKKSLKFFARRLCPKLTQTKQIQNKVN